MQDVRVTKMPPCDLLAITAWEQRYSTQLPEVCPSKLWGKIFIVLSVFCLQNIRDFYLASDGFRLSWSYNYAGQLLPLGNMTLNRVADLRRVGGLRYNFDTEQPTLLDIESVDSCGAEPAERKAAEESLHPQFGLRWKIFEDSVLQFLILSKLNASYPPIIGINANMQ